jgi:hypothetical protein
MSSNAKNYIVNIPLYFENVVNFQVFLNIHRPLNIVITSSAGATRALKVRPLHSPERPPDAMEASLENVTDVLRAVISATDVLRAPARLCDRIVNQLKVGV